MRAAPQPGLLLLHQQGGEILGWSCGFTALCLLRNQAESSPGAAGGDAGVVVWPQLPQQSSGSKVNRAGLWNCYHKGKDKRGFFSGFVFIFFFPLVFLYLGPGPGCQRGFGVSVHSLGSCLILASKLGLQLPCPVVPGEVDGEVDGLVAAAMNWAAA